MPAPEKIGFLFPGQGAQFVGMGKDFYEKFPSAQRIFDSAETYLQYPLTAICFEGPEEKLTRTLYAQPAIFVMSLAVLAILTERYPDLSPKFAAGLSLGEFTALTAAGSFSFLDGLRLVQQRAEAMEKCAASHPGTMASIIGLAAADCEALAKEAGCEVANINSSDQIVLSGTESSIHRACRLAETRGAKRALPLKVAGAFHSSLMRDAQEDLEKALKGAAIRSPKYTFVSNVTASAIHAPEEIRKLLARQLTSPVRWAATMEFAGESGISFFIEIGPGKVLKGLARKRRPEIHVEACGTASDIQTLDNLFAKV